MKNLLFFIILVIVFNIPGFAQESKKNEKVFEPDIKSKSIGLLFGFNGEVLNTDNYDAGIGARYYLNDNLVIRGALEIRYGSSETPEKDAFTKEMESKTSKTRIMLDCSYLLAKRRICPYLGFGIGFSTITYEFKQNGTTNKNSDTGRDYSFYFLGGAELFILKYLSISTEYRLTFSLYSPNDSEIQYEGKPTQILPGTKSFSINTGSTGLFTVAFYF
jgi:opacity protein-like surface antigen